MWFATPLPLGYVNTNPVDPRYLRPDHPWNWPIDRSCRSFLGCGIYSSPVGRVWVHGLDSTLIISYNYIVIVYPDAPWDWPID